MSTSFAECLQAVDEWLGEEVAPALAGRTAFELRVARNLLRILEREQELAPRRAAQDQSAADTFGLDVPVADVPQALAGQLRANALEPDARLIAYLRQRTLLQLAIDNPRYASYRIARDRWRADDSPAARDATP